MREIMEAARSPAKKPEQIQEALWWVTRWISGSMDDPDWDWPEAEAIGVDRAFQIVHQAIGNKRSIGRPLYRYIAVSEAEARRIVRSKTIKPYEHGYQSFTTSFDLAKVIGEELCRTGDVHLIVGAEVPPEDVMFGMADLKASRLSSSEVAQLADWHHQEEVVVRVGKPLRVVSVKRVKLGQD